MLSWDKHSDGSVCRRLGTTHRHNKPTPAAKKLWAEYGHPCKREPKTGKYLDLLPKGLSAYALNLREFLMNTPSN